MNESETTTPSPWRGCPKPTRSTSEVIDRAIKKLLPKLVRWIKANGEGGDETNEQLQADVKKALRYDHDGYALARNLDSAGWSPDAELVEILDDYSSMIHNAVDQCVKEWVEANGIKPKLAIGTKVALPESWCKSHFKWLGGQGIGEITAIPDYKAGSYALRAPWQDEGTAYILDFAEVEAFQILP